MAVKLQLSYGRSDVCCVSLLFQQEMNRGTSTRQDTRRALAEFSQLLGPVHVWEKRWTELNRIRVFKWVRLEQAAVPIPPPPQFMQGQMEGEAVVSDPERERYGETEAVLGLEQKGGTGQEGESGEGSGATGKESFQAEKEADGEGGRTVDTEAKKSLDQKDESSGEKAEMRNETDMEDVGNELEKSTTMEGEKEDVEMDENENLDRAKSNGDEDVTRPESVKIDEGPNKKHVEDDQSVIVAETPGEENAYTEKHTSSTLKTDEQADNDEKEDKTEEVASTELNQTPENGQSTVRLTRVNLQCP